ncbi:MAG: hypothetical protein GY696_13360, partial [Gammaproteobacteria bacterium]|nr:hypothetical protein [Gammaproteobacteria bacterium]
AQEEKEQTECINVLDPEEEELPMAVDEVEDGVPPGIVPRPNLDINLWLQSQQEDPVLAEVRNWLTLQQRPSKDALRGRPQVYHRYAQVLHEISIGPDQILRYTANTFAGWTDRILVPEEKKFDVFRMAHDIPSSGHFGIHATAAMALRHFWYPGLNADIRNRIRACVVCVNKDIKVRTKAGAYVPGTNGFSGQTLYVDLVQMNKSPEGYQYIYGRWV